MPLLQLQTGQNAILKDITWDMKIKRKLYDMGMTPGTPICMINSSGRGPVILDVRGSRLALGRAIIGKIEVELVVE